MNRRKFFKSGLSASVITGSYLLLGKERMALAGSAFLSDPLPYDLVAVRGGEAGVRFDRGIVQRFATEPGTSYEFRAWLKYEHEGWPNRATIHVGWDPTGQTVNATVGTVQWTADLIEQGMNNPVHDGSWDSDIWYQYRGVFQATGSEASVWFRGMQVSGTTAARIYVDDVEVLGAAGAGGPPTMRVR